MRYTGRCREANLSESESRAWRVRVPDEESASRIASRVDIASTLTKK